MATQVRIVKILTLLLAIALPAVAQDNLADSPDEQLESRLAMAGENRAELTKALDDAPEEQRAAVEFLIRNMPRKDLTTLSSEFLLEHVRLAYQAKAQTPWTDQVSEELFLNDVLPYAHVDETREAWRAEMFELCWPIVKDCQTPGEAAQELNKHLFRMIKVKYSTKRKKANQSPSESIDQGLASCTGLSILLADACRSVNVPARLTGIPRWANKRGNHTWVEVWDQGDWHFTGAAEYNAAGLDRAWFTNDAALADKSNRLNSIYSISFARTETTFPMVWSRDPENAVYAVNVTDRYTPDSEPEKVDPNSVQVRIRVWNADRSERIATKVFAVEADNSDAEKMSGTSPSDTADMNDMLQFALRRGVAYELHMLDGDAAKVHRFTAADEETQLVEIVLKK